MADIDINTGIVYDHNTGQEIGIDLRFANLRSHKISPQLTESALETSRLVELLTFAYCDLKGALEVHYANDPFVQLDIDGVKNTLKEIEEYVPEVME